jgi:hypothetical protein
MKYADFIIQSIMISLGFGIVVVDLISGQKPMMTILMLQLVLGPWQMISSLISIVTKASLYQFKKWHFLVSLSYLLMLFVLSDAGVKFSETIVMAGLTIPAWILGGYYYYLTWRKTFAKITKSGTFLPNIFF